MMALPTIFEMEFVESVAIFANPQIFLPYSKRSTYQELC
jgi:hypothetical protein